MENTNQQRIQALRRKMLEASVHAYIIPTTDPHISEYTPSRWKTRAWLSGFTGSAGTVVVTRDKAALWTDSRYFIQAEEELQGSGIRLFKMALPGTPSIQEWIASELHSGETVAFEGEVYAAHEAKLLQGFFVQQGLQVDPDFAPFDAIWEDRPSIPRNPLFELPEAFSGKPVREKIQELLQSLKQQGANTTVLATLDAIAWLFNIRGNDVEYNPVAVAYAVVSEKEAVLFVNPEKLTQEVAEFLQAQGVILADYAKFYTYLSRFNDSSAVLVTPSKVNYKLYTAIPKACTLIETDVHPVDHMKAIKNETELSGFRHAMKKDGVALVKFLIWLEEALAHNLPVTELAVSKKLYELRSEQPLFFGESFSTITGYGEHGAVVHYEATEASNSTIRPEGLLLVDSGAQYFDGTTDITRTVACGPLTEAMKRDYTNVLKGHIQLAMIEYPAGTVGMQLDILARQFLWKTHSNYLHGTGHGIGHFLNVHEGPQSIRMNYNPVTLLPGMITSNEPGIYRQGQYGVRIENLILTTKTGSCEYGDFYGFETITLCPIDKSPILTDLLTKEETDWLNTYHQKVYDELSGSLNETEKAWLTKACSKIE